MSRIFRIAEMYHELVTTCEDDLIGTMAADALAILTDHAYVAKTMGNDEELLTLADGKPGQVLVINLVARAGTAEGILTPTTCAGFNTIIFLEVGDQVVLFFVDEIIGWVLLSAFGLLNQPEVT